VIRPYRSMHPRLGARAWVDVSLAKVRRPVTEEERAGLRRYAENYLGYKEGCRMAEEAR
jgi:hypothetical protein